ncbi:MAG: cell division protein FtsX [Solitalea-like symbiont of Acarus siro]
MSELEKSSIRTKTKKIYISTVLSMAMLLYTLAVLIFLLMQQHKLTNKIKEKVAVNVFFKENVREADVLNVKAQLQNNTYINKINYISKEKAAETLKNDLGEDFLKFLGVNPLLYSLDIYMKANYSDKTHIESVVQILTNNPKIKDVLYNPILIEDLNKNINILGSVMAFFSLLMFILSVALISNTVNLSVFSERCIIKSMQLIGATRSFIRMPYLRLGVLYGFLSALSSIVALVATFIILNKNFADFSKLIEITNKEIALLFIIIIGMGVFISCLSTWMSVNKYLKYNIQEIYI